MCADSSWQPDYAAADGQRDDGKRRGGARGGGRAGCCVWRAAAAGALPLASPPPVDTDALTAAEAKAIDAALQTAELLASDAALAAALAAADPYGQIYAGGELPPVTPERAFLAVTAARRRRSSSSRRRCRRRRRRHSLRCKRWRRQLEPAAGRGCRRDRHGGRGHAVRCIGGVGADASFARN